VAYPEHPARGISPAHPVPLLHAGQPIAPRKTEMPRMNAHLTAAKTRLS
jgi:hypothetical protein